MDQLGCRPINVTHFVASLERACPDSVNTISVMDDHLTAKQAERATQAPQRSERPAWRPVTAFRFEQSMRSTEGENWRNSLILSHY